MRASCLINNYNYAQYVADAVQSALNQTVPFEEVILVDDGSTDGSTDVVLSRYRGEPRLKLICKANEGQLSCFNVGWEASTGDIIFFLDADDTYQPTYLEQTLRLYSCYPHVDFIFTQCRHFGPAATETKSLDLPDSDLGYSLIPTLYTGQWLGAPTSCLSIRRELLSKILPIPWLEDWRIRADDCLVLGASLACGAKYYHGKALVNYRLHGKNGFAGVTLNQLQEYRHRIAVNRLISLFANRMGYDPRTLAGIAHHEFRTMNGPIPWRRLKRYSKVVWQSQLRWTRKLSLLADMTGHFLATRLRSQTFGRLSTGEGSDEFRANAGSLYQRAA